MTYNICAYGKDSQMKALKKIKVNIWLNALMLILIGVLLIVTPHESMEVITIVAGVLIFGSGILDLVYYVNAWIESYFFRGTLFAGILKCILGIFVVMHASTMTLLFSYIFSIFIIVNGVNCMELAIYMRRIVPRHYGWFVFLAIMVIAAGIIMLFVSPDTVSTAALIVGIVFIINGITDIILVCRLSKIGRIYADELKLKMDEWNGNIIDENIY